MSDPRSRIRRHLAASAAVILEAAEVCSGDLSRAGGLIIEAIRRGGRLLLCGNGGSAADSQHLAAEFVNRLSPGRTRQALPALALTTDTSVLTSLANDCGVEAMFARQVEALGRTGDVLLILTTSGRSRNLVTAAEQARRQGLVVVVLSGESGGPVGELAQVSVRVPSGDTAFIQEVHLALGHALTAQVEEALATD